MKIEEYLDGLASLHGKALNTFGGKIFIQALSGYPEASVMKALNRCAMELKTFPTIADVLGRIEDGHPGVEEAWAMVPKTEHESVVWTEEIKNSFYSCFSLIDEDPIAARMAFKEIYSKALLEVRSAKKPPKWEVSLGKDKLGREKVLTQAVEKGRITQQNAAALLPDISFAKNRNQSQIENLANNALGLIGNGQTVEILSDKTPNETSK